MDVDVVDDKRMPAPLKRSTVNGERALRGSRLQCLLLLRSARLDPCPNTGGRCRGDITAVQTGRRQRLECASSALLVG